MKTFLICPVRGVDLKDTQKFMAVLEKEGYLVHYPPRDTDQTDTIGLQICTDNMEAIKGADVVHFVWDGKSQGCLFDLGMAFVLGKKIIPLKLPEATSHKSFQNMVTAWSKE